MQKVISINLNGHAYQLEESGFETLRDYLARAESDLEGNPDRAEIMADLEQAIADKCARFLGAHKSVVTAGEVDQIVREMGPIDAHGASDGGDRQEPGQGTAAGAGARRDPAPKKLFRISEGAMFAGVCTGLAAYFAVDVVIVRLAFVTMAIFSGGVGTIVYLVMMFVVPQATTPEQEAAAGGAPFNAQEVVDRAKQQYAEGARQMRRQWRRQQRQWRRSNAAWNRRQNIATHPPSPVAIALLPVFGLMHLVLFLVMAGTLISLVNNGAVMGREVPHDVPMWAAVLTVLVVYQILASPLRAAASWSQAQPGWYAFWNSLISLAGLGVVIWYASHHMPEIREFLQEVPHIFRDFMYALRDFFTDN